MRDKRFVIAILVIIVLAVALLYVALIGPKVQGYFVKNKIEAQQEAVNTIIQIVNQQGYVVLGQGENAVVLVKYPPASQGQQGQQTKTNSS